MKKILLGILLVATAFCAQAQAQEQTLKIGIEGAYPPFNAVDTNGKLYGFDVDIANALCTQMKVKCEYIKIDWDGLIPSLLNEKIDAIISSMSATDERKKTIDFTDKYYSNNGQLVMKKADATKVTNDNWQDMLKGKVLGVQTSTVHDYYATDKLSHIVKSIERYNTQDEANLDLAAGRIDVTLADQTALSVGFLKTPTGKDFAFATPLFNDPKYYGIGVSIGIRQGDTKLKEAINVAIKAIRENGEYQKINKKYFDFDIY